jgi:TetR/AcrR family transcriptional regulator, transcriptional repressor of bet genes
MPKRVDHEMRRRQIIDAVARITARGGLGAATFREVAAEASVSVSLVQYYFGTKADLLLATHQQVGRRVGERLRDRLAATPDDPRARLRATFEELVPHDDESREAMLLFVSLYTVSLTDPTARPEAADVPAALWSVVARELRRARLRRGVDPARAATVLTLLAPALGQSILGGALTTDEALAVVDYELGRIVAPGSA